MRRGGRKTRRVRKKAKFRWGWQCGAIEEYDDFDGSHVKLEHRCHNITLGAAWTTPYSCAHCGSSNHWIRRVKVK